MPSEQPQAAAAEVAGVAGVAADGHAQAEHGSEVVLDIETFKTFVLDRVLSKSRYFVQPSSSLPSGLTSRLSSSPSSSPAALTARKADRGQRTSTTRSTHDSKHDSALTSTGTATGSIYLLGTLRGERAIVHVQRTMLVSDTAAALLRAGLESVDVFLENRPYFSAHALISRSSGPSTPDLVLKAIWPATETHIRKHTVQPRVMVRETPEMYERVVKPYMASFPPDRLEWVYNILQGKKEAERVLYRDEDEQLGFVIIPDLKWDQTSMSALYLQVIVRTRSIRSLRDLDPSHLPLLHSVREKVHETALQQFGVEHAKLRLFVHYQPSYYHFHVHVVHIDHEPMAGMTVGQAHLLDTLISLLELSPAPPALSILARMTFTYALGVEHELYKGRPAGEGAQGEATQPALRGFAELQETPLG